jgi:coenzyme F420-reducing hydrogenase gamma subunit
MTSAPLTDRAGRLRVSVHKFSSCDGCQLALLNAGEDLLALAAQVDFIHFAEFGRLDEFAEVDVGLVEGSISTAHDIERIKHIRARTRVLVSIGACATAGGIQALRNLHDAPAWTAGVYAHPEYISALAQSTPPSDHVRVDLEVHGCPVNARQLFNALRDLMSGVAPAPERDALCVECKRKSVVCVMVARGLACMGPVTRTGCGVLCPRQRRDCYGCTGPVERPNAAALAQRFQALGLGLGDAQRRFIAIHAAAPGFAPLARAVQERQDG